MKKLLVGVAVFSTCATSALAGIDGSGVITQNPFSFGNGGQFTITPTAGYIGETGMAGDLSGGSFESFCLERNEYFSPGGGYNMCINTVAIAGGLGGPSLALDPRVAFLYFNFRMGSLVPFDYGAGRQASAGLLQAAIWYFQGGQAPFDATNPFIAAADTAVNTNAWSGLGPVRVLNVYSANGERGQDQLTIIPTPGAAALLGVGVLASSRRRRV